MALSGVRWGGPFAGANPTPAGRVGGSGAFADVGRLGPDEPGLQFPWSTGASQNPTACIPTGFHRSTHRPHRAGGISEVGSCIRRTSPRAHSRRVLVLRAHPSRPSQPPPGCPSASTGRPVSDRWRFTPPVARSAWLGTRSRSERHRSLPRRRKGSKPMPQRRSASWP
jgi:hypothetical protein